MPSCKCILDRMVHKGAMTVEERDKILRNMKPKWIPVSERLPEYGVAVLTYDGNCYSVEKRIPTIRDDNGEPISGEWWVSDDYDESNSEYYPNLRDGACIAWMPLPESYKAESEKEAEAYPISDNISKGFEEFTRMMFKQGTAESEE